MSEFLPSQAAPLTDKDRASATRTARESDDGHGENPTGTPWTDVLVALGIFVGGLLTGYALELHRVPALKLLGKTDGIICYAVDSRSGEPLTIHWLARPDGSCYADDLPR